MHVYLGKVGMNVCLPKTSRFLSGVQWLTEQSSLRSLGASLVDNDHFCTDSRVSKPDSVSPGWGPELRSEWSRCPSSGRGLAHLSLGGLLEGLLTLFWLDMVHGCTQPMFW